MKFLLFLFRAGMSLNNLSSADDNNLLTVIIFDFLFNNFRKLKYEIIFKHPVSIYLF